MDIEFIEFIQHDEERQTRRARDKLYSFSSTLHSTTATMGVQKRTRKFAQVKRSIGQRDARLYVPSTSSHTYGS